MLFGITLTERGITSGIWAGKSTSGTCQGKGRSVTILPILAS